MKKSDCGISRIPGRFSPRTLDSTLGAKTVRKRQKDKKVKTQTIRRTAWAAKVTDTRFTAGRDLCAAEPGQKCWVWLVYPTKRAYREGNFELFSIVHRSTPKRGSDPYYAVYWHNAYAFSFDTYAEAAYALARQAYGLDDRFLVPSEILASFHVSYTGELHSEIDDRYTPWIDEWSYLQSKVTNFGKGRHTPLGEFLISSLDSAPCVKPHSEDIMRPAKRKIVLGSANTALEASSAICGMDDQQASEVADYLDEPVPFRETSRKEKRRIRKAQQRQTPHYLEGLSTGWDGLPGKRTIGTGATGMVSYYDEFDIYDIVTRHKKPRPNPTPLGKKVEGRRFIECPENWEDRSDMQFRDIMDWKCARPDNSKDRIPDEECLFELELG